METYSSSMSKTHQLGPDTSGLDTLPHIFLKTTLFLKEASLQTPLHSQNPHEEFKHEKIAKN